MPRRRRHSRRRTQKGRHWERAESASHTHALPAPTRPSGPSGSRSGSNCSRTRRPCTAGGRARRTRLPPRAAWRPLDLCTSSGISRTWGKHREQAPPMAGRWRGSVVRRSSARRRAVWSCWRRQHRRARPCPVHSRRGGAYSRRVLERAQCKRVSASDSEASANRALFTDSTSHRARCDFTP